MVSVEDVEVDVDVDGDGDEGVPVAAVVDAVLEELEAVMDAGVKSGDSG